MGHHKRVERSRFLRAHLAGERGARSFYDHGCLSLYFYSVVVVVVIRPVSRTNNSCLSTSFRDVWEEREKRIQWYCTMYHVAPKLHVPGRELIHFENMNVWTTAYFPFAGLTDNLRLLPCRTAEHHGKFSPPVYGHTHRKRFITVPNL